MYRNLLPLLTAVDTSSALSEDGHAVLAWRRAVRGAVAGISVMYVKVWWCRCIFTHEARPWHPASPPFANFKTGTFAFKSEHSAPDSKLGEIRFVFFFCIAKLRSSKEQREETWNQDDGWRKRHHGVCEREGRVFLSCEGVKICQMCNADLQQEIWKEYISLGFFVYLSINKDLWNKL